MRLSLINQQREMLTKYRPTSPYFILYKLIYHLSFDSPPFLSQSDIKRNGYCKPIVIHGRDAKHRDGEYLNRVAQQENQVIIKYS